MGAEEYDDGGEDSGACDEGCGDGDGDVVGVLVMVRAEPDVEYEGYPYDEEYEAAGDLEALHGDAEEAEELHAEEGEEEYYDARYNGGLVG